jgi:polyisoprenoid-binding protein YceI
MVDDATIAAYDCAVNYFCTPPGRAAQPGEGYQGIVNTWHIDPAHTDVLFSAKHMMVTTVRGTFADVSGTLDIDEDDPTSARGEIRIRAASVDSGFAQRDAHLRSPDFFDVERYPDIVFRATDVARAGASFKVTGDLTIRDVTRAVTFDVELEGIVTGMSGARHLGLTARTSIDREDWGLTWNVGLETGGWLVGKEIRLEIEVAADEAVGSVAGGVASAA